MTNKRQLKTMCPMNCHPTYCGMRVEVENDKLVSIKGDPDNPDSHGFLCIRGRAAHEIVDNPKRLLHPLRRVGKRGEDRWEAISWDEALTTIAASIRATHRERVAVWSGHGSGVTGINRPLIMRFGYLGGFQTWNPAIVCWALGAYGLALTGVLQANTKEDMAEHAQTIIFWGANIASQPTTAPHLVAARKRGAKMILIDCRKTEAARHADDVIIIRPGTDAALALAMANVIVREGLVDAAFIRQSTLGYAEFADHLTQFTPQWAAEITGVPAAKIEELARLYATAKPAMIVLGGSSMFKHRNGWEPGRAVACLPALTGQLGIAGGGFGPRHRSQTHATGYAELQGADLRLPGNYIPSHMPSIAAALTGGQIDVLFLFGTNMLSSFAEANKLENGLDKVGLIVASDIFSSETIRRVADIVLPSTIWLEETGLKDTASHIYLMDKALPRAGEARPTWLVLRELAEILGIENYFPWGDEEGYLNAMLAPQKDETGESLTIAKLRDIGGYWQKNNLSHIAYPNLKFATPSGKIEFWSERAAKAGLPPLPAYTPLVSDNLAYPLELRQGRSLTAFHSFYDQGRALPTLAKADPTPEIWVHALDAAQREIEAGSRIVVYNNGGRLEGLARVTEDIAPGTVWVRDGWYGVNHLTSGAVSLPLPASDLIDPYALPGGQAAYDSRVEVARA